ncbi:hypothetical protein GWC77_25890 [Paraburkholderia sp. NMBU_R16]|uniref:hypothetical protein n=1 Tax=Paraburkholderia sp. NMBU_R16 TaxID=2698676 RepID=UPI001563FA46|nr:hypothetical protein [Paraburkholderia sp. NMBU_R16]NRO99322.1 hypothetical protein [Paraburkholderia sp. NMBU_R16]
MSERKPMRTVSKPRGASAAARLAPGHTLALGTVATGKTVYGLLRLTPDELRLMRRRLAEGTGNAGDEAWA